jgi:hypothetical protein
VSDDKRDATRVKKPGGTGTRFQKGQSGNLSGRPKAQPKPEVSPFDIIVERTLTIEQNGKTREVTLDEALCHRTYQDAIAGNRMARREVLKMIKKFDQAHKMTRPSAPVEQKIEPHDPANAEDALLLLGIAELDTRADYSSKARHLLLAPWATQAALSRRGRTTLNNSEIDDVERCTRDSASLRWAGGVKR